MEIVLGPRDFESARKHKDEDLGLTVKELTYEMSKALNLEEDAPGVVLAKVAGEPISSLEGFAESIKKAREADRAIPAA